MEAPSAFNNGRSPPSAFGVFSQSTSPTATFASNVTHSRQTNGYSHPPIGTTNSYTTSPTTERKSLDHNPQQQYSTTMDGSGSGQLSTIILRRLPSTMSREALTSMLLFAEDFVDAMFIHTDTLEDKAYQTAVARFRTSEGAHDVRNRLNGRLNATNDAAMVVELHRVGQAQAMDSRRNTSENQLARQLSTSASSGGSSTGGLSRQTSRYSGTFQSMDKLSPPRSFQANGINDGRSGDVTSPNTSFHTQYSPLGPSVGMERNHISGKSVIGHDNIDEETGELLRDPIAYAKGGLNGGSIHCENGNTQLPTALLANLHLNTDSHDISEGMQQNGNSMPTRTLPPLHSPIQEFSPNGGFTPMSPSGLFSPNGQFQRTNYPPANPADQNPPCNTLYVGNLPLDASEDELKALFSKQRGYKRLCYRTKHNGPMCFVEFEDITFATKALNDLYGTMLHNSIKGGIRLSFSKNPLGVRTGQGNGMGPMSPLSSPSGSFGNSMGMPPGFGSANGPPPGLSKPPGLISTTSPNGNGGSNFFTQSNGMSSANSQPFSMHMQNHMNGFGMNAQNGGFPNFMMGR